MRVTGLLTFSAAACLAGLAVAAPAHAGAMITIDENLNSVPTAGFAPVDLSAAPLGSGAPFTVGNDNVSFVGTPANQGVVNGSLSGQYAAPVTNAAGNKYTGNYFSTGNAGYIDINFASPQLALALLWGSVDLSNDITFLSNGVAIGNVLGSDINANANGSQGYGGSFYVLLNLTQSFDEIQLSSGVTSFEAAEFGADSSNFFIPEPTSLAVLGAGLLGLTLLRRRNA